MTAKSLAALACAAVLFGISPAGAQDATGASPQYPESKTPTGADSRTTNPQSPGTGSAPQHDGVSGSSGAASGSQHPFSKDATATDLSSTNPGKADRSASAPAPAGGAGGDTGTKHPLTKDSVGSDGPTTNPGAQAPQ